MEKRSIILLLVVPTLVAAGALQLNRLREGRPEDGPARLHSGWTIHAVGSRHEPVGDFIVGSALRPGGAFIAMVSAGYGKHGVHLLSAETGELQQSVEIPKAWNGIAWSPDGAVLYVSGGETGELLRFAVDAGGRLKREASLKVNPSVAGGPAAATSKPFIAGIASEADGKAIVVADLLNDAVYRLDASNGKILTERRLRPESRPYALRIDAGGRVFVAELSTGRVNALAADLEVEQTFEPGRHPNDLAFAADGRVFVTCGSDDWVAVLDPRTGEVTERIVTGLSKSGLKGSTPNAVDLSPDGKTLYVANADANVVTVVDVSVPGRSHVRGMIPTGWYPTRVVASPSGRRLLIGSGKGMGTWASAATGDDVAEGGRSYRYIASMFRGYVSTVENPSEEQLRAYTREAIANSPFRDTIIRRPDLSERPSGSPIPAKLGDRSPIQHVLYIIKENRTYDQILGDLREEDGRKRGDGEPSLTLFGEKVTPNTHALAREYVTMDRLFCSGEVSGNGHPWSTGAYSTDLGERAWVLSYSRGTEYVVPDQALSGPSGRIWDVADRAGLSWRSYYYTWTTSNTRRNMPAAWAKAQNDETRDKDLADIFLKELEGFEKSSRMPRFMIMSLREDHTFGTSPGKPTPTACVASNDQAVGKIIAGLSRSKFWGKTAVFIIEDDAQSGPDHVDAHRTVGLVVSPYTRTGKVDSRPYTSVSMLRTMELILGLPPMTQHDAAAPPMYTVFVTKPDLTPYRLRPAQVDLEEMNPEKPQAALLRSIDFSKPDQLTVQQEDALNRAIWASVKPNAPYPSLRRRGIFEDAGRSTSEDDD